MDEKTNIEYEESSGNVFADLGLDNPEELAARVRLGFYIAETIKGMNLKQREIGKMLNMAQPDVSHLMNGHFDRFTVDKMCDMLTRLGKTLTLRIGNKTDQQYQDVTLSP
ncbi:conserved hypothetical protein [Desulfatibacillum aliphaticivorans]|uniref:HigA2-like helix-turn-helix domain-containing protein n=1 Tax=Desulfatibacillum aliphaticivorans TaxID=218208 RepID=B8FLH4_DESAL|nr:helix-turn-helix transcriptional regulator [Desulfatibacillum aliphaticivorans]ACL05120.1 conserved hypothetical protein [Desulfatibacillum aliphaticivorans]